MTDKRAHKEYEQLADKLLEEWVRQKLAPAPGQSNTDRVFQGRLALSKTMSGGKTPNRRFRRSRKGTLEELPYYPAQGKESKPGSRATPATLIGQFNRINAIMERIKYGSKNGRKYWLVLYYSYRFGAMELVASELKVSVASAKQLKRAALDQVVLLLQQADELKSR